MNVFLKWLLIIVISLIVIIIVSSLIFGLENTSFAVGAIAGTIANWLGL